MINAILYFTSSFLLIITLWQVRRAALILKLPIIISLCVYAGFLLYISSLIPGILGVLNPFAIAITLSTVAIITLWSLSHALSRVSKGATTSDSIISELFRGPWNITTFVIGLLGFVGIMPLIRYLIYLPATLFSPDIPLPWDTVSYHLPGLIEYLQANSLWSLEGPYQSYSFGFELIAGFPSFFFHSHWGLLMANAYSVLFLLAAIVLIIGNLLRVITASQRGLINPLTTYLLSISIWCVQFRGELARIGKNDIFMTACVLSTLGLLLELRHEDLTTQRLHRRIALLLLAIAALGLGLASKPTALAYVPLFIFMVGVFFYAKKTLKTENRLYLGIRKAGLMLICVLAIGGFFYFRNLLAFGAIVDPALSEAWKRSLVANLTNPALYVLKQGSAMFALALVTPLLVSFLFWRKRAIVQEYTPFLWMLGFHIVAILAFANTPHAIFHESLDDAVWKTRLGMPLFTSMAISGALGIGLMAACFDQRRIPPADRVVITIAIALAVAMPWWWTHNMHTGLPGYESVKGMPKTRIYQWVQKLDRPVRIYAAGLRPYGLYGPNWRNRVFYDLHSAGLEREPDGKSRLLAVIQYFHPDLVLISIDPHQYSGPLQKPLVQWMRTQHCFFEVYSDDTASAFEVRDGWQELLKQFPPPNMAVRMGG